MSLDRYTTQQLIDELALREQLRVIREQCRHSRYCAKLGAEHIKQPSIFTMQQEYLQGDLFSDDK